MTYIISGTAEIGMHIKKEISTWSHLKSSKANVSLMIVEAPVLLCLASFVCIVGMCNLAASAHIPLFVTHL